MRLHLTRHPGFACTAVESITVDVTRIASDQLRLRYSVTGPLQGLLIPPAVHARRISNLWEHTCLEAFVAATGNPAYHELNFSPSSEWASFGFSSYRQGMHDTLDVIPVTPDVQREGNSLTLETTIALPPLGGAANWDIGVTAVMEERDGALSYWALAHPDGPPDFHNRDCFVHKVGAAVQP